MRARIWHICYQIIAMNRKRNSTKADYTKLRRAAYELIVEQGKTQKEAAAALGVTEATISSWAMEGDWRGLRKSRQSATSTARENIIRIISLLSEKRLELEAEISEAADTGDTKRELELRAEASSISLDMAYQNKALADLNKDTEVTLGIFVDVFDEIFSALRQQEPALFEKTIPFQTAYLRRKSNELG